MLDRFVVALVRLLKVFDLNVLVTTQCMRIREELAELDGSIEVLQSLLMLFLKRVAVTKNAPCFRLVEASLESVVCNIAQISLLLQLP